MTIEKPTEPQNKKSIQLMTSLYKKHYEELWESLQPTSRALILDEPLGRRANDFAHEVAKQAEIEAYSIEKIAKKATEFFEQ
jgi:hypothetical protein